MLLSQDILAQAANLFAEAVARNEFDESQVKQLKKSGELSTIIDEVDRDDERWFTDLFQSTIQRDGKYVTFGELLDADLYAPGGVDAQSPINPTKVKDGLVGTEVGMCRLLVAFVDIECVSSDGGQTFWVGGGRHRRTMYLNLFTALGFTEEQMRDQLIRVQMLHFTGELANKYINLYVINSNRSRTMTPAERKGYVMTATLGVHHKDTDALLASATRETSKTTLGNTVGLIWRNLSQAGDADPCVSLTDETWRKLGVSFLADVLDIKQPYVYTDGEEVKTPSGKVKTHTKYDLYVGGDLEGFVYTGYDAVCTALEAMQKDGTLPSNTALKFKDICAVAVETFDTWCTADLDASFTYAPVEKKQPKKPVSQEDIKQAAQLKRRNK